MCSSLVSVHGLKNEFIFMCSALGISLRDRGRFKSRRLF